MYNMKMYFSICISHYLCLVKLKFIYFNCILSCLFSLLVFHSLIIIIIIIIIVLFCD